MSFANVSPPTFPTFPLQRTVADRIRLCSDLALSLVVKNRYC